MIWHWINSIVRWMKWFWLPPAPKHMIPMIDLHAPCPWCGHCDSIIRAVPQVSGTVSKPKIVRHCNICQGDSEEAPVIAGGGKVLPEQVASPPPMN